MAMVKFNESHFVGLLCVAWFAAFVFYWQIPLNHDVSWYLVSTGRLLDGERAYRDVIELNPPLAFYLTMPPIVASRIAGLTPEHGFVGYLLLLMAASLALVHRLLGQLPGSSALYRRGTLVAVLAAYIVLPMSSFGQREHLMFVLALPYILLLAVRMADGGCRPALAVLIGALAVAGFGLKPYFLIVPVLLEIYAVLVRRSLRVLFRAETWTLGAGIALYAASIFLLTPEYPDFIVPMATLVYGAYGAPMNAVIGSMPYPAFLLAAGTHALTRRAGPIHRATDVLALAAAGFIADYLAQSKGWLYHLIPALATVWLMMMSILLCHVGRQTTTAAPAWKSAMLYGAVAAVSYLLIGPQTVVPYRNTLAEDLLPVVQKQAAGGSIAALTSYLWVGFPLVNEAHVAWASRFPAQWLLPGVIGRLAHPEGLDASTRQKLLDIERYNLDAVIDDLRNGRPDIVLVDDDSPYFGPAGFDYLAYFSRDQRFIELWQSYVRIGEASINVGGNRRFEIWCRRYANHDCAS
jgi:hypothetical protein